jgi:hypothetical protein
MDDRRFDALVKRLAVSADRRGFVKGLLGLGGAALVGTTLPGGVADAARRPASSTSTPINCPGDQYPFNGKCICAPNEAETCGADCCLIGVSTCCDGACCHGYCYGEELCCPTGRHFCDVTNECCRDGEKCCPGIGCYRPDRQCCTDDECAPYSGICTPEICGPDHVCVSTFDCRLDTSCCDRNGDCFTDPCLPDGTCGPSVADCRLGPVGVCCPNGGQCLADGKCCWPTKTTCNPGECGEFPDGCGGRIDCGSCPGGEFCQNNQTCCVLPRCFSNSCGVIDIGCGAPVDCGACPAGNICRSDHTCCPARTCSTDQCGEIPDGCGGWVDCGDCPNGHFCRENNLCCAPIPCTDRCGTINDGCGGNITCENTCPSGTTCQETVCVPSS